MNKDKINQILYEKILTLLLQGLDVKEVSKELKRPASTIYRYRKRIIDNLLSNATFPEAEQRARDLLRIILRKGV